MHEKKLYGTATVGTKGQVVIPLNAREELKITTGESLYVVGSPSNGFVMLLKEDMVEQYIQRMDLEVEKFKKLKKNSKG